MHAATAAGHAVPEPGQGTQHHGAVAVPLLLPTACTPCASGISSCCFRECTLPKLQPPSGLQVFSNVTADSAINNLSVLGCGIALAAHSLEAAGAELPACGGARGEDAGAPDGRQQLLEQLREFLRFVADRHAEFRAADKEQYALKMSPGSLFDLLHAQAALAAMG